MRKLLLIFGLLLCATTTHAQLVTVSGNLGALTGAPVTQQNAYVLFTLQNFGSNIPRVIGTNAIVSQISPPFTPNGSGAISGSIQSNDSITPANTFYRVCVYYQGSQFQCNNYTINYSAGTTWNLNTATPTNLVPAPPVDFQNANTVYAGPPSGAATSPSFRPLIGADLPAPATTTKGGVEAITCPSMYHIFAINVDGSITCTADTGGGGGGTNPSTIGITSWNGTTWNTSYTATTLTAFLNLFSPTLQGLTPASGGGTTNFLRADGTWNPLPSSLGTDNAWTNNNRFGGPIPWRDVTAGMPSGGCNEAGVSGSREVGTISGGSLSTLSLTYNNHMLTNGCGVFIANAGPASTLSTPAKGAAPNPNVIGLAGSTTLYYKVAAIDCNFGTSAASAAISLATAPATRTSTNYVGFYWISVSNACGYLTYISTDNITYVPLGYSFACNGWSAGNICGAIDKGTETNTWTGFNGFWPTTPPASVTNDALVTTFTAGGASNTLTLATPATNAVSGVFVMADIAPFIKSAIAAASTDGGSSTVTKGIVLIPNGFYFASTFPFPATGTEGVKINLAGAVQLFGLPIEGALSGGATSTGFYALEGLGGIYSPNDLTIPGNTLSAWPTLGALAVASGGGIYAKGITFSTSQAGIIDVGGFYTFENDSFNNNGSGPELQIDNNSFFSVAHNVNFNANNANNNVPAVWFLGLTNSGHTSVFVFDTIEWISHTVRVDIAFPGGGGPFGDFVFTGQEDIEDNYDPCFICLATNNSIGNVNINDVDTGDAMNPQLALVYNYNTTPLPGNGVWIHGQTTGWNALVGSAVSPTLSVDCRGWTYENPSQGGTGINSRGYVQSIFGKYSGCDLGLTTSGSESQSTSYIALGGNDSNGPGGEYMAAHAFRRPITTLTSGSGSLSAATYYVEVAVKDVAGRFSAPSPEQSIVLGPSASISVSAVTGTYFPAGCRVYFGTSSGGEADYFDSTTVTNGTCTYSLTTTSGQTAGTPALVGNAMRSWLSLENNAASCLGCGTSNGGTGWYGFNLSPSEYTTANAAGGPGVFVHNITVLGTCVGCSPAGSSPPTIASGFGSGASIVNSNGTAAFTINVGTSNTGTGVLTMPSAPHGWACMVTDGTTTSGNVFITRSVPTSSTSVTLQNYTNLVATHAWVDSDVLEVTCGSY
jgi:hypothetical protein